MSLIAITSFARRNSLALSLTAIVVGASIVIPACHPSDGAELDTELDFAAAPTEVFAGQTATFHAFLHAYGDDANTVTGPLLYSIASGGESYASIGATSGVLTANTVQSQATRTIEVDVSATSTQEGFLDPDPIAASVTIKSRVTGISLTSAGTMNLTVGSQQTATATPLYASGSPTSPAAVVEWISSNPSLAAVDASGKVTALAVTPAGQPVLISMKSEGVTGSGSIAVTITPGLASAISVSPNAPSLRLNEPLTLTAQVVNPAPGNVNVTWVSASPASVSVASTGAGAAQNSATATITGLVPTTQPQLVTASYIGNGGQVTSSSSVTVLAPSIVATPRITSLALGETHQLQANVTNPAFSGGAISYISSDITKATVSQNGLITAIASTGVGNVSITARYTVGTQTFNDVMPITIRVPTTVVVSSLASGPITLGSNRTYTAAVADQFGTNIAGAPVTWSIESSTPSGAATLAADGTVSCTLTGDVKIRATSAVAGVFGEVDVHCGNAATAVAAIVLDPYDVTMLQGSDIRFRARLLDANGDETTPAAGFRVIYSTNISAVALVKDGDNTTGYVTGIGPGTTGINAYYVTGIAPPVLVATSTLHVASNASGAVYGVQITTNHTPLAVGGGTTLAAIAYNTNGVVVPGVQFRWSTTPTTSLAINATTGQVTTFSNGGALMFASAVLPGAVDGPTGISAVTVGTSGAILGTISIIDGGSPFPAVGATLRAYQGGVHKGVGVVPLMGATPGRAYIPGLAAGTYTVTVHLPGYAVRTFTGVVVPASGVIQLNGGVTVTLVPE